MSLFRDLFTSQCATKGSAERSTHTILVACVAHNLAITIPASPPVILFQLEQTIVFQPVHLFNVYTLFLFENV